MQRKVLLIDDDVDCLESATEYLSDQNFNVISVLEPTCPMLKEKTTTCRMQVPCYDLVLSDNQMPGMTGLEFFQLQAQRGCKVPPHHKALMSGNISKKDQKIAEDMGYKVFHKPTPLDLLDGWIAEIQIRGHDFTGKRTGHSRSADDRSSYQLKRDPQLNAVSL